MNKGGRETLRESERAVTGFDAPAPRFSESPAATLYQAHRTVSRQCSIEQTAYTIIAASALLAAGGGLYWVAQLVNRWTMFGTGIEKLIQ
jgi:hypothetical protein